MDFSKFKPSDWLKVGGGAVMLIAFFLPWWSLDIPGVGDAGSVSGSDYFFTGVVPWLLLIAVGVLTFLAATGKFTLPSTMPAPLIFLAASALAFLLVLIRFFSDGFDYSGVGYDNYISRGAGLYLALLAAIAVLVGSFMGFKESGGDLNDLKNVNKLKGQFSGGPGAPPPPPGMQPPPPPPPPGGGFTPPPPPPPV
ncbi:MAG: hypothetical protein JWN62_967 [Acidimicrobiales bacterium]|nr:hypothetical protein [Acidimicrobiales bacterium]